MPQANPRKSLRPKNADLHGSAPDKSAIALIVVDVINDLDFPEAKQLARFIPALADSIARLKRRAKAAGVPVIYVNDNFGRWRSDFRALIEHCRKGKGRSLIQKLYPEQDDYFVLKPKHSGFFSSTLETLLRYLGVRRLIITGIAGNFCVLFTANDAYMRDYELAVPSDCVIANTAKENTEALELMKRYLKADTRRSQRISFGKRKQIWQCQSTPVRHWQRSQTITSSGR
jgi:nicotinamidase-related amidase